MSRGWPSRRPTSRTSRISTTHQSRAEASCATTVWSCRCAGRSDRVPLVIVEKAGLVAMLLEVGEENPAVLLARSDLPDEIDTDHDLDAMLAFGLERDQL